MRNIDTIIIHCSATKEGADFDVSDIRRWHVDGFGWADVGYHFVIKLDGTVQAGRPVEKIGAHAAPRNTGSIGICYIGGVDSTGKAKDTRTPAQKKSLLDLVRILQKQFNIKEIIGHRDVPGVKKACPCFDVKQWAKENNL